MPSSNGNNLQNIIASQAKREIKQFTKGYHFIYRSVEQQIKTQISRNPLLLRASVTLPQYARGNIVIPMGQGKTYVCKQLHTRGIHVVQDDGRDGLVVSWASLTTPLHHRTSSNAIARPTITQARHRASNSAVVEISSSESSSSSSSSNSPEPDAVSRGNSSLRKKIIGPKDASKKLPPDVERQVEELHTLVLRAASGC